MAYNKKNQLKKVKKVQNIYTHYHSKGVTDVYIFKHYIENNFNISIRTFYTYLAINVAQELKKLEQCKP